MTPTRRILLFYDNTDLDRQILRPVDYSAFEDEWNRQGGGNSGNKLFTSAIEQYLNKEDIEYDYYKGNETVDVINDKYDLVVIPMANIFNANSSVVRQLNEYTTLIKGLRIPVYILGCGIQCGSYDNIRELADLIRKPVEEFLKAIYQSGGELALRGYATKEFLDKIMLNSAVVTGCPSFFQKGPNLQISNEKVKEEIFRPVINGNLKYLQEVNMLPIFAQYPNSIYMDQDEFAEWLYFKNLPLKKKNVWKLVRKKTYYSARLLTEDRVKLIYDIPCWIQYLEEEKFHFSCGSRIHGNIAAILAGVPAMVLYRDARTRELAEFIELPCRPYLENKSLYEEYLEADYSLFNKNFNKKFKIFEEFLVTHGITHNIEDRALFEKRLSQFEWKMPEIAGEKNIEYLKKKFKKNESKYILYGRFLEGVGKRK